MKSRGPWIVAAAVAVVAALLLLHVDRTPDDGRRAPPGRRTTAPFPSPAVRVSATAISSDTPGRTGGACGVEVVVEAPDGCATEGSFSLFTWEDKVRVLVVEAAWRAGETIRRTALPCLATAWVEVSGGTCASLAYSTPLEEVQAPQGRREPRCRQLRRLLPG